jgi:glutathione S-transferase
MTLYLKAGPDGTSVGDCPFAHFVRLVLEEKGLDYTLKPSTAETKPNWLLEHYQGKMPALRHRKECYVDSSVIADYLEFFFPQPSLASPKKTESNQDASAVMDGFFPAVAQYIKTPEDGNDAEQLKQLESKLDALNAHLELISKQQPPSPVFLEGTSMTLLDCKLMPQLYHLQTAIEGFKQGIPNIQKSYPHVAAYYEQCAARPSFQATIYPKETVLWGWGNARK